MTKAAFTPNPFPPPTPTATSASPSFTLTISPSARLVSITVLVVLKRDATGLNAEVFRESTSELGYFNCDLYDRKSAWVRTGEAEGKFTRPTIPADAHLESIGGHDFYTVVPLTEDERAALSELAELVKAK